MAEKPNPEKTPPYFQWKPVDNRGKSAEEKGWSDLNDEDQNPMDFVTQDLIFEEDLSAL